MADPPTLEEAKENQELEKKLIGKAKGGDIGSKVLLVFLNMFRSKQEMKGEKSTLILRRKSSVRTQLSLKMLQTNFMSHEVRFVERLEDDKFWSYDEIAQDRKKQEEFKQWFIKEKAKEYKIDENCLMVHKISKGSKIVDFSTTNISDTASILRANKEH